MRATSRPAEREIRGSSSPWITSVGARTVASSARRSPEASMASIWRAMPWWS